MQISKDKSKFGTSTPKYDWVGSGWHARVAGCGSVVVVVVVVWCGNSVVTVW